MGESKKTAKNNTFKFVNFTNPSEARESKVRTQVRSHVSRWQHSQSRARVHHATQSKPATRDSNVDAGTGNTIGLPAYASNPITGSSTPEVGPGNFAGQWLSPTTAARHIHRQDSYDGDKYTQQDTDEYDTEATLFSPEAYRLASSGLVKSFSQGAMSFRTIALQDSQNIIGVSLKEMQLELSSVMGLYKNICELQAVDFARQYDVGGDIASWGRFYTFVYTDPILLSTAVLLGVRNQLDILGQCIDGQTFASVMHIERFLMRSINDALGDPVRGISDQMLIAVALCAAYEIKHGTGACYHIHMQGLVQMIQLRGGLIAIGSPDPYIVRLLIWIDINTSKLANCRQYLQDMVNGLASHPHANTTTFRARGISP